METKTAPVPRALEEMQEIFAKETWTQADCCQLHSLLFRISNGTEKFRAFAGQLLAGQAEPTPMAAVKAGIVQYMLGDFEQAIQTLAKGTDNRDRRWYQGLCCRNLAKYDRAIEEFDRAASRGWDDAQTKVAIAQCRCLAGDLESANKAVQSLVGLSGFSEYHVLRGMVMQAEGEYDGAEEAYGEALDLDHKNTSAAFRLAFLYDMHGDEQQAVELYEQCLLNPPVYANALINLAVLYEDAGQWDKADRCLKTILSVQPNHPRAKLYAKDIKSSRTMYYDEDLERWTVQRNAVLDIPVTDFELSVRARNCLKKMNIHSLGDLLKITEADLLGSKNFGETSLAEIKTMLAQKGLQLGQEAEIRPSVVPTDQGHGAVVG
ncbi:MAG: tetratricopeptide repeat protein, partial [Planctomycetes bacterium]|nr:tetratricopeptide repeat protein [Planctomycetota bacterium]